MLRRHTVKTNNGLRETAAAARQHAGRLVVVNLSVTAQAKRLRKIAESGPIGKRHSSFALYDLLAKCMALTERCHRNPQDRKELDSLLRLQPRVGNRRYIEKGSDEYTLVCRFVFAQDRGRAEHSNSSRYAAALRQAAERQIGSADLADVLRNKGGINALFLRRPLDRTDIKTKCLHLARTIEAPKGKPFTLTLRRLPDNTFDVLTNSFEDTKEDAASSATGRLRNRRGR